MSVRFRAVCSEWRPSSPGFSAGARVDERLPADYLEFVRVVGPGEGFVGTSFIRLYPLEQVASATSAYAIESYLPQHLLFGSDGGGNALLFDCSAPEISVLVQPFIPLDPEYATTRFPSWSAFLESCFEVAVGFQPQRANPNTFGLEVHERHPIVLGGDPSDPANKMLLAPPTHAEACVFFNKLVQTVRNKQ